ncbi:hypothetical protein VB740_02940 [Nostoc sp. UHCC 0251]|nr:hypothetical protein [Nostoc sp. UHCC 0251]
MSSVERFGIRQRLLEGIELGLEPTFRTHQTHEFNLLCLVTSFALYLYSPLKHYSYC